MTTATEYDFDPRNLSQDLLSAIGLVTTAAAQTEKFVEMAIAGCLGVDAEYGASLTTHMAMPLRFSVLRSCAEIRINNLDLLDKLDALIEKIEMAFVKRNGVVHHEWCRDPKTGNVFTVKETARTSYALDLIPMTIENVKSDAAFIYQSGIDLMAFLMRCGLVPEPPPIRPRAHKSKAARKKRREGKL